MNKGKQIIFWSSRKGHFFLDTSSPDPLYYDICNKHKISLFFFLVLYEEIRMTKMLALLQGWYDLISLV